MFDILKYRCHAFSSNVFYFAKFDKTIKTKNKFFIYDGNVDTAL